MSGVTLHQPLPAAELLAQTQNQRRIDLIRQCANEARESEFERRWLAVLERCAQWFSTVPLNADLYREPGGAFRFTVETAFYAMRLAGGQKFGATLSSEQRRRIEPQYNHAVFLAAVCSGLDEPYRHFEIVRERDQAEWNPSAHGGAAAWLGGSPYVVRRRAAPFAIERMRTAMLAQMLIGQELLAGLDAAVLSEMLGAINPSPRPDGAESLIHKVVRHAIEVAADFDRKAQRQVFEPVAFSVPSAVHVAAAVQPATAPIAPAPVTPSTGASVAPSAGAAATHPHVATPPASTAQALPSSPPVADGTVSVEIAGSVQSQPVGDIDTTPRSPVVAPDLAEAAPGVDQLGLPFLSDDPAKLAAARPASINPADVPTATRERQADSDDFATVLKDVPNMIRELFRVLREDVAAGKAAVRWDEQGLVVSKRLVGSYGVASDTLVEHLRKRSLLVSNGNGEIIFGPRAGELILARGSS
ncbi:conjugal transfer pilus assembly protein TraI [Paraburkholderia sp. GAS41]|uniref:TraI domain-containing protein n=1 Tax=Paraburkholderia sp. GAS41 TaxID=3035134 RepID=UPI003D24F185